MTDVIMAPEDANNEVRKNELSLAEQAFDATLDWYEEEYGRLIDPSFLNLFQKYIDDRMAELNE